jgi:hypothetical protein
LRSWTGRTSTSQYGLVIGDRVRQQLDQFCRSAGAIETGGILIGHYTNDLSVATITEATPAPADSRGGSSWFTRGVLELRDTLAVRWRASARTHYVGEWHYHPVPHVVPSPVDFAQMVEISRAERYKCREPLLVILGSTVSVAGRPMRAFVCPADGQPEEFLGIDSSADQTGTAVVPPRRK